MAATVVACPSGNGRGAGGRSASALTAGPSATASPATLEGAEGKIGAEAGAMSAG
jgi:hypothetical protein